MSTSSSERFQKILKEAPYEYQKYLVHVTKYQAAKNCKVIYLTIFLVRKIFGDYSGRYFN